MKEFGKRPGAMIYFADWRAVRRLSMEQRGELITAIMEFAENGVAQVSDDPLVAVVFDLLSEKVARDAATYRETCINRAYSTYCRECKKDGNEPVDRNTWYQLRSFDTMQDHSESIGIIQGETETEPETESEPEPEMEIDTEPEPEMETEMEAERERERGAGRTEGRGPAPLSTKEVLERQRKLSFQIEEYRQRNGDFPDGF